MKKSFTDQIGRTIKIGFPPKRIVSLVPSQTELLFDIGLDEEIVGVTKFCIHPKEKATSKTNIGGTKKLHLDKIAALEPDLIIGNKEENDQEQITELSAQFPVWISDVKTLENALDMIVQIGELTGKLPKATAVAIRIQAAFEKWQKTLAGNPRPKAAFFIWKNPYMVAASDTFVHAMLEAAGFQNVFSDKTRYPATTLAEVADRHPDLLLLSSEPFPFSEKHLAEFLEACPTASVVLVDGEMFSWHGSRMLQAVEYFGELGAVVQKDKVQTGNNDNL